MNAEQWQETKRLLAAALARPTAERAEFLRQSTASDEVLQELESLLRFHGQAESENFLQQPPSLFEEDMEFSVDTSGGSRDTLPIDRSTDGGGDPHDNIKATVEYQRPATVGMHDQIENFRIERELGRGGFGVVYLARDVRLNRDVAIKIALPGRTPSRERTDAFQEEARTLAALDGHGVVPVHSMGHTSDGNWYIVSRYIEGGNLKGRMKQPVSPQEAARLAAEIAETLSRTHAAKIVHRDLKPANVLLDGEQRPILADFGLAVHDDKRPRNELSGTQAYMAPEQVRRESQLLDGRTDIWALGVILFEMLTGKLPFSGDNQDEIFEQIQKREATPLRQVAPNVPAELERITLKCLEKRTVDRYATGAELASDLRSWLARVERPNRLFSPWMVAVVALLVIGIVGLVPFFRSLTHQLGITTAIQGVDEQPLVADVKIQVYGEGKEGVPLDDPASSPLFNGDQVRFDLQLSKPSHVYLYWIDAHGEPAEIFPHDPDRGPQGDTARTAIHSPAQLNRGWEIVGESGMETAIVLVRSTPYPHPHELAARLSLAPAYEFNHPNELVTYASDTESAPKIVASRSRGLGEKSTIIDNPVLELMERLRGDFEVIRVIRIAHAGD